MRKIIRNLSGRDYLIYLTAFAFLIATAAEKAPACVTCNDNADTDCCSLRNQVLYGGVCPLEGALRIPTDCNPGDIDHVSLSDPTYTPDGMFFDANGNGLKDGDEEFCYLIVVNWGDGGQPPEAGENVCDPYKRCFFRPRSEGIEGEYYLKNDDQIGAKVNYTPPPAFGPHSALDLQSWILSQDGTMRVVQAGGKYQL